VTGLGKIHSLWEMEMIGLKWGSLGARGEENEGGGAKKLTFIFFVLLI